jgi:hypothetical protein
MSTQVEVIEDIQDRLGNGRPPVDGPEEDAYYDRYDVNEAAGDLDSERGVSFQMRDVAAGGVYVVNIKRQQ